MAKGWPKEEVFENEAPWIGIRATSWWFCDHCCWQPPDDKEKLNDQFQSNLVVLSSRSVNKILFRWISCS